MTVVVDAISQRAERSAGSMGQGRPVSASRAKSTKPPMYNDMRTIVAATATVTMTKNARSRGVGVLGPTARTIGAYDRRLRRAPS